MLTIFTPTYNRKCSLMTAYTALLSQTCQNFMWLIVDDGSSDGTSELVQAWVKDGKIKIEYHYQENSGKMKAHNKGVFLCQTELFTCVDSDDYLTADGVESIYKVWDSLPDKTQFAGIVAHKGKDANTLLHNTNFPSLEKSTLINLYQSGFAGETTLIYRTDLLKQFPFPEFPNENFIPEDVVYNQIDDIAPLYIYPKILTICEYHTDGLSNHIKTIRNHNPHGYFLYYQVKLQRSSPSFLRYKYTAYAILFAKRLKLPLFTSIPASSLEIILALPAAYLLKLLKKSD